MVVGRPFANAICMILAIIRMKVLTEKCKELVYAILITDRLPKDREGMSALRILREFGK
jgi:hypothetical protein